MSSSWVAASVQFAFDRGYYVKSVAHWSATDADRGMLNLKQRTLKYRISCRCFILFSYTRKTSHWFPGVSRFDVGVNSREARKGNHPCAEC